MALRDYPEWVLKYKQKGTEIRFLNGKYYLYKYHSIRVDGKPKKITDEYLGRITEQGLIPPTPKPVEFIVKEFSSTTFVYSVCKSAITGTLKKFPNLSSTYLPYAFFITLFNNDERKWNNSYLSILFYDISFKPLTGKKKDDVDRIVNMMSYHINKILKGIDINIFLSQFNDLYMVYYKDKWYLAKACENTLKTLKKYNISLEIDYGKNQ